MNILITGGASGLGEANTKIFSKNENYNIYLTFSHSAENAKNIESKFCNTFPIKCDFKDIESVK